MYIFMQACLEHRVVSLNLAQDLSFIIFTMGNYDHCNLLSCEILLGYTKFYIKHVRTDVELTNDSYDVIKVLLILIQ